MSQDVSASLSIGFDAVVLEFTYHFTYLGSTFTKNLSLHIDNRIDKTAAVMSKLSKRVYNNSQ